MSVVVTLAELKLDLGVTFSASDTRYQQLLDQTEGEVLNYCGLTTATFATLYADVGEQGVANLQYGIIASVKQRIKGDPNIWAGGWLARMLLPYRVPAVSGGTTS